MSKHLVYKNEAGQVERCFLVHFVIHTDFDLSQFLSRLPVGSFTPVHTEEGYTASIEVTLTKEKLRSFIGTVPKEVLVSYEEKAPEAC